MSPGYDRADHFDFRRKIGYDCFFCHDAYPAVPAGSDSADADPVYPAQLPEGIDCQRCHGPGSAHVAAAQGKRPGAEIRQAIVNPARLPADRQLEICMQCHLETTSFVLPASIQRYERGTFSFRPGEPLADFMLHFDHAKGTGHDDKFEIVSAAYRLRQSACFQASDGELVCTTCHNPHRAPRGDDAIKQYTAACQKCHQQKLAGLVTRAGIRPAQLHRLPHAEAAYRGRDSRRDDGSSDPAPSARAGPCSPRSRSGTTRRARIADEVVLYYPPSLPASADRDLYLAVAQVAQKSNLDAGIPQLEAALRTHPPRRPEFYMALAQALMAAGRRDQAIATYRTALQGDPQFLPALRGLGAALKTPVICQAPSRPWSRLAQLDPRDAATLHELGLAYHDSAAPARPLSAIQEAIRLDPDLPEIRNSLGNMLLEAGDRDKAEESLREAIRSQPDFAAAHADLGNALAAKGDVSEAEREYHVAIQLDPANATARYGYGAALASRGRFDEAQKQIEEAVKLSPDFAEAQTILGDLYARRGNWLPAMTALSGGVACPARFRSRASGTRDCVGCYARCRRRSRAPHQGCTGPQSGGPAGGAGTPAAIAQIATV